MKKIFTLIVAALVTVGAWATDKTIKTVNFHGTAWSSHPTASGTTVDGCTFNGTMAWATDNTMNFAMSCMTTEGANCIAIPLTDINGSITVTIGSTRLYGSRCYYYVAEGTETCKNCYATNLDEKQEISYTMTTSATTGTLYIGRYSSEIDPQVSYIEVTTPPKTYQVTYDNNGHGTAPVGEKVDRLTLPTITENGYTNTEWVADKNVTVDNGAIVNAGTHIACGTTVGLSEATKFTAQWETYNPDPLVTYDFSRWSLQDITSSVTYDNLTVKANATNSASIIATNRQPVDKKAFTRYLKIPDASAADYRTFSFNVTGPCKIDVYLATTNVSAEKHILSMYTGKWGEGTAAATFEAGDAAKVSKTYSGVPTTLTFGASGGGIYVYGVNVEDITYKVTYDKNGHSTAPADAEVGCLTLPTIVENGYTNTGWVADKDVTVDNATVTAGTTIACGKIVVLSADTKFTAQWEIYNPTALVIYDFSRWSLQDITSSVTYDKLTAKADASHPASIVARKQTIDEKAFTRALYIQGASAADYRTFSLNVTGPCTINVYLATANAFGTVRKLSMYTGKWGAGTAAATFDAGTAAKVSKTYSGGAATLTFGASGGIYVYGVDIAYHVSYDNNGHGTAPAGAIVGCLTLPTIAENGYTNIGWVADKDVTVDNATVTAGTTIECSNTAVLSAATKFTAQWETYNPIALVTYDFSRWSVLDITSSVTYDNLTAKADASHPASIAARSEIIDKKVFIRALCIPGPSAAGYRTFSFNVTGPCTITAYLASTSASGEVRTLSMYTGKWGEGTAAATFNAGNVTKVSKTYSGGPATLTFGASGGMYVYGVDVDYITYKVTYDNNGHGTAPANANAGCLTLPTIAENGYTNTGWVANKNVTVNNAAVTAGTTMECSTTAVLSEATKFTAQWETYNPTALVTYDFSRWSLQDITYSVTYDKLTAKANASNPDSIVARKQTINEKAFTRALCIPGASAADYRTFSFNATGPCTIDVYLASTNASGTVRTLSMYTGKWGEGTAAATFDAGTAAKVSKTYSGGAATLTFGASGGMYVYGVDVNYSSTAINTVNAASNANAGKVIKTANCIIKDGKKYNFAGQQIK